MAKAYKCDYCGKLYTGIPDATHTFRVAALSERPSPPAYITSFTVYLLGDRTEIDPEEIASERFAEICPDCHHAIAKKGHPAT
jgi:hypothetical protein